MGLRQVYHMYVIANSSAVGRRVVATEYLHVWPLPQGNLQYQRDEVGLRIVHLPELLRGACRVEVAQRDILQPFNSPNQRSIRS